MRLVLVVLTLACSTAWARPSTSDRVLARISTTYMAGIKRCYKDALKKSPSASGIVAIDLVVGSRGKVLPATRVRSAIPDFDDCVTRQTASWRFPFVEVRGSYSLRLVMKPD